MKEKNNQLLSNNTKKSFIGFSKLSESYTGFEYFI